MQVFGLTAPRKDTPFVDKLGKLSDHGMMFLEQIFRQLAPGYPLVSVNITGTNDLTLTPILGAEGAASYGNYMAWVGVAATGSTGSVTAHVASGSRVLSTIKVFKSAGAAQAGNGDLVAGGLYVFFYNSALDSGAGGFVVK